MFGDELKEAIELIFSKNTITPAKALEDVKALYKDYQVFHDSISQVLEGFEGLKIGKEELEAGQCELGYGIPREFVENKLSSLKIEISELNFILNSVSEAVTGERQEYEVKTISSSDYLLYIVIGLNVAGFLATATERILNIYKSVLEIKVLRNELKKSGIPLAKTKSIDTHANSMMAKEIKAIAKEAVIEYYDGQDNGRKNEVENSVVIALNKLANRIDKGFNVEIRVAELPEAEGEEEMTEEQQANATKIKEIQKSAKNIKFIDTGGQSILRLPEKPKK